MAYPAQSQATAQAEGARRAPSLAVLLAPLLAVGSVGLIVLLVTGFEMFTWGRVTPGVSAFGISLGGLSLADAQRRLQPATDQIMNGPLHINAAGHQWDTTPAQLGLRLSATDVAQTAHAVGREGNPLARFRDQVTALSGRDVSIGGTTDQAALRQSLVARAREVEVRPADAQLALRTDGKILFTPAQPGLQVDLVASAEHIRKAIAAGQTTMELVVLQTEPAVGDAALQPARDQLQMITGDATPFSLTLGDQRWQLSATDIAGLVRIVAGASAGQPTTIQIDAKPLGALVAKIAAEVNQTVQEPRFAFAPGSLKVIRPSKDGRALDEAATVALVTQKLLAGERAAELPVAVRKPAVSSENPASLGITELIDRGSTSFAGSIPEKKWNIKLAAERLSGVIVPPGGIFSFNKEVGPTTLAAGFKWGFGLESGAAGVKTVPSVAGGICQVATTLFQPVFWAGYALEERYWHLYWIPAYTSRGVVGLDVTVDADSNLDFKWSNPTSSNVLVQSSSDDSNVYFALYGKKPNWKLQVDEGQPTNRVPADPKPVAQPEPTLPWGQTLAVESARDGFDITVVRKVISPDSTEPRVLSLKSSYQPSRNVTLVGTGGKPAGADVQALVDRIEHPAIAVPTPSTSPTTQASPVAAATRAPAATAAPRVAPPGATPLPAPTALVKPTAPAPAPPAVQPTPKPLPNGVAPTAVPTRKP